MTQQIEKLTVTQTQAAEMIGVTSRTIRKWDHRKLLCGKVVGGVKLYSVADIRELVLVK